MLELRHKMHHGQQFALSYAIIALCLGQHLASISNNLLLSILNLRKDGANTFITGICIQYEVSFWLRMNQNRCLAQFLFEVFKGLLLLLIPSKRSLLLSQLD